MTVPGVRRLDPEADPDVALVVYAPSADPGRVERELGRIGFRGGLPSRALDVQELVDLDVRPAESTPRLLAALMAILLVGIVVHVVVSVNQARRRDLAVLRTLGFTPGQVRMSAAWQASTTAVIAAVAAGVLGVVGGRAVWNAYAERIDVVPEAAVPWVALGVLALAVLVCCNLVAWLASRRAARMSPAAELRSE
jgi:hypothetical protein